MAGTADPDVAERARGAVTREGEGTFVCGVGGAYRADLDARQWVGAP